MGLITRKRRRGWKWIKFGAYWYNFLSIEKHGEITLLLDKRDGIQTAEKESVNSILTKVILPLIFTRFFSVLSQCPTFLSLLKSSSISMLTLVALVLLDVLKTKWIWKKEKRGKNERDMKKGKRRKRKKTRKRDLRS